MAVSLGAVATRFHRAPTPAVILSLVDEQVATATIIFTFTHTSSFVGREQFSRGSDNWPQYDVGIDNVGRYLPVKLFTRKGQL